jgi:hypothetical protein
MASTGSEAMASAVLMVIWLELLVPVGVGAMSLARFPIAP